MCQIELMDIMLINRRSVLSASTLLLAACSAPLQKTKNLNEDLYEVFDNKFYELMDTDQSLDIIGQGYTWCEGPTWDRKRNALYFTDVPGNIAYEWRPGAEVKEFLNPSGAANLTGFREAGANGLLYSQSGKLLICNHGERAVQEMDIDTKQRKTLVSQFEGKAFNSPNDLIESGAGDIYFTDPPYGLEGLNESPLKELVYNGVYKLSSDGEVSLLADNLTFPNGVALSPDEKTLYIAQSDPLAIHIYTLDLTDINPKPKLWRDLSSYSNDANPGLPDGMAIDVDGNVFATGPGGIFVITPTGKILGRIKTGKASANCAFGEDGHTLFITNHDRLVKLQTKTRGLAWM